MKYAYTLLSFLILLTFSFFGFRAISQSTQHQQKESLEKALRRGILECYAQEGRYPESLDYLVEHYHIIYNEEYFDIHYKPIAGNIMPSVTVIEKR